MKLMNAATTATLNKIKYIIILKIVSKYMIAILQNIEIINYIEILFAYLYLCEYFEYY